MRPIHRDRARARLAEVMSRATRGVAGKVLLLGAGACLTAMLVLLGHSGIAILPALLTSGPAAAYAVGWARRRRRVRRIAAAGWSTAGLPSARQTLRDMGIDDRTADPVIVASQEAEVRIAAFDQNNRVCSEVGPIPLFADLLIAPGEFRPRARHALDLV
ncbi:MAG: hypothetical protein ACREJ3_07285, partial [Polyangiaceae bacterium]